jgi:hypothetical protein
MVCKKLIKETSTCKDFPEKRCIAVELKDCKAELTT